jgi:hypothetical protein
MKQSRRACLVVLLVLSGSAAAAALPVRSSVLPWIDDDYGRALSEARARHVPIFAEAWAPW